MKKAMVLLAALLLCAGLTCGVSAQTDYTIIHRFSDGTVPGDGENPMGSLVSDGSRLYGMTYYGGTQTYGAIFSVSPDGTGYTILHNFPDPLVAGDGERPTGDLLFEGGRLYGMTPDGGAHTDGVVFSLNPDGSAYTLLHDFGSIADDGENPQGSLLSDGSRLYGMTPNGGSHTYGTIFSLDPLDPVASYAIHHHFGNPAAVPPDGEEPFGSLISDGSRLYGLASDGGYYSCGTVFSINTDGSGYTILHDFAFLFSIPPDGWRPFGSLLSDGTSLYGMTLNGGAGILTGGIAFSMDTDGSNYSILHDFPAYSGDGANPLGSLISDGSRLYGMTYYGGQGAAFPFFPGYGTVFSMGSDGSDYSIIHSFAPLADGENPMGSLVSDGTALYGMTYQGSLYGAGVIFSYALPTPTPTPTPLPNYINIEVSPETVNLGDPLTLSWQCDFNQWNYHSAPVDIYLAAIRDPAVIGAPSSVADAQSGGVVIFFGDKMKYYFPGVPLEPTWSNVAFPPVKTSNSLAINLPLPPGDYTFAATFLYRGPVSFVRDDGLPVENSNLFTVQ